MAEPITQTAAVARAVTGGSLWRMPAEWEPHAGCLMAWPTRRELWHGMLDVAEAEYAGVANAIVNFEALWMVVTADAAARARKLLSAAVELVELPIDDSWLRDSGPIFVRGSDQERRGVDFRFNSWGERFCPYDQDALLSERVLEHLGIERIPSGMVLEGGSITVDGQGSLITTEQCLLNPNRNALMSREEIESELRRTLGVEQIIWLPFGRAEDAHTDGHVDLVCVYTRPGTVIVQGCEDPGHPDFARMRANRAILQAHALDVIEVPLYPYKELGGHRTSVSYVNFYIANGAIILPVAETVMDLAAVEILRCAFPEREVVCTPARCIAFGGGGVHCITQQVPAP